MTAELFLDGKVTLHAGDCLAALDTLPDNSIDACVTDPPYHLASIVRRFGKQGAAGAKDYSGERDNATGAYARASRGFMGKEWDGGDIAFRPETWAMVLRVLKPGAHLLAFSASKNFGHLQIAVEAAGFETRDAILDLIDLDPMLAQFVASLNDEQRGALLRLIDDHSNTGGQLAWLYGSGFPKSHDIAKAIDKKLGVAGHYGAPKSAAHAGWIDRGAMRGDDGHEGYQRPWMQDETSVDRAARQYIAGSSESAAWAGFGTALKPAFEPIVLARKPLERGLTVAENCLKWGTAALNIDSARVAYVPAAAGPDGSDDDLAALASPLGRWPANVVHDGSDAAVAAFPDTGPTPGSYESVPRRNVNVYGGGWSGTFRRGHADDGSAARFFYSAKADSADRLGSRHPTVKPVDLIQYLIRLVTRPGQTVLDPFAGTGTAGEAAFREGRRAVLIEREAEYQDDIRRRMALVLAGPDQRRRETIKEKTKDKPVDAGPLFGGSEHADAGGAG